MALSFFTIFADSGPVCGRNLTDDGAHPLTLKSARFDVDQPKYSGAFPGFHLMLQPMLAR